MAKVELKQPIVQEISENIKDAQSVVVVDYRGLTVAEDTQLRKALREAGVTYKVYKNTLVSRAVEGTQFESLRDVLEGPNAFAISTEDATAPQQYRQEKNFFPNYLEAYSLRLPTLLAFSIRSQKKAVRQMQQ